MQFRGYFICNAMYNLIGKQNRSGWAHPILVRITCPHLPPKRHRFVSNRYRTAVISTIWFHRALPLLPSSLSLPSLSHTLLLFGGAMTTSLGAATASAAASVTENAGKSTAFLPLSHRHFVLRSNSVSFRLTPRPKLRFSSKGLQSGWNCSLVKAQLNKVDVDGSSKAAASTSAKSEISPLEPSQPAVPSEESISQFVSQVASLIKLVDSKDIVELQLKQLDCEVLIRKKEALPQPASPPITYYQSQPQTAIQPPVSAPFPVPAAAPSTPSPASSPPKAQPAKSSHPPLKCPMAGTFYRSPGPGEPPFVKVGDKVKKGQVVCIIEAMKLMNEIEADQAGTIVEVLAEDAQPVSVDTPLFVIEP